MAYILESLPDKSEGGGFVLESLPEQEGFVDRLARVPGRTLRAAATGVAGIAAPFANPLGALWNTTAGRVGAPKMGTDAIGAVNDLLDRIGVSRPQGGAEESFDTIGSAATGTGGTIAAARMVPGAIAEALSSGPGMQLLSTLFGSGTGEVARQADAPPLVQAGVSLAASAAPSVAQTVLAGATRSALRGAGDDAAAQYNRNRLDWERVGVEPSVGQASGGRVAQGVESTLSKTPGGAGVMAKKSEAVASQMRDRINEIADSYLSKADAAKAGATVEKGIKGFVQRFKGEQDFLYNKLDELIPDGTSVRVDSTKRALAELNADIPDAPELSKWFKNAKIQGIEGAVQKDAAAKEPVDILSKIISADGKPFVIGQKPGSPEGVPYEALKKLRTLVGRELESNSLVSDVPRSKWKALYAALSDDLEAAAVAAGPKAEAAFNRANWYSRAGYDRIETVLDRVSGKDTAEAIFKAAVNPSEVREGATTINAVMRSLNPEERKAVSAAVVRRMGQAKPGNQNDVGDVFSSETFLTNWNNFSDDAKRVLFSDPSARRGLDDLALAASRIRQGSRVFANPSGTSGGVAQIGAGVGLTTAAVTGNMPAAASILAGIGAANVGARLMTNPKFVAWVGRTTKLPPALLPAQLTMLEQQTRNWPDEDRQAVQAFIESVDTAGR